jgi:hypothetical protein
MRPRHAPLSLRTRLGCKIRSGGSIWESVLELHRAKILILLIYPSCIAFRVFSTA